MIPFLPYLKAYAALVGSLATAMLGIYAPDTVAGQVLTVAVALTTAIATFAVPNIPATEPDGEHELGRRGDRGAAQLHPVLQVSAVLLLAVLAWILAGLFFRGGQVLLGFP
ncbi:hypothetical protein [Nocardioides sp. AX2bis]|uniref:hypothetical protein n=1 Tax=Nocardioides sp. AX2bis TaxID=2653157 RepID=UPI0012EFE78E|nr:hypothetical protein [Nocardioides sp. AX2bis]VXC42901.1 Flagellar hook-length control protein fliK [Nocardioides sp. AX2bis]